MIKATRLIVESILILFESVTCKRLASRRMARCLVMALTMAQACLSYGATSTSANQRTGTPTPLNWHKLELQDAGMLGSITTRIDLSTLSATDVQPTLVDGPKQMSPRAAAPRIQELVVSNTIQLLLGAGIETQARLWFNADDGLPLQLVRIRQGSNPSRKLYRFGSNRVYRLRNKPGNSAETGQPPENWSQTRESFYPLPAPDGECPAILESSQLLTLLTNPDQLLSERPVELCVFDRKHVYRVEFRVLGREQLDIDYLQLAAGKETRVRRTLEALHVVLTSRPLEGAREDVEPFSFLGLKDEIHFLLSDPGRIPLRVRGQVPGFGMIDLELKKLTR